MNAKTKKQKDFAAELREGCIAIRVNKRQFGKSRRFDNYQKHASAEAVGASDENVIGGTKLYAKNDPYIKQIARVLGEFGQLFRARTRNLPGERATRLLRRDRIDEWTQDFNTLVEDLDRACDDADNHYEEIMAAAKAALTRGDKSAFNPENYPSRFSDSIEVKWSVHNFKVDESLMALAPETWKREVDRMNRQLQSAVATFDNEMREQMANLVEALLDKLNPVDGKKVKYTESAATNLKEFFNRFRDLSIGSDEDMESLIDTAGKALDGISMRDLKQRPSLRNSVSESFTEIKAKLDTLVVDGPARSIDLDDLED